MSDVKGRFRRARAPSRAIALSTLCATNKRIRAIAHTPSPKRNFLQRTK
ncbi:MAG: hypothetical protein KME57_05240 [Scytonema hyalinum WJT4-NPBG1]|nr:hypothetical protein [Scytonema hyalinum WJT4-NPBG1]